jgi:hypothetical protein
MHVHIHVVLAHNATRETLELIRHQTVRVIRHTQTIVPSPYNEKTPAMSKARSMYEHVRTRVTTRARRDNKHIATHLDTVVPRISRQRRAIGVILNLSNSKSRLVSMYARSTLMQIGAFSSSFARHNTASVALFERGDLFLTLCLGCHVQKVVLAVEMRAHVCFEHCLADTQQEKEAMLEQPVGVCAALIFFFSS